MFGLADMFPNIWILSNPYIVISVAVAVILFFLFMYFYFGKPVQ